jgi:hypothetical protein
MGVSQVNLSIGNIDQTTQKSAANSQELSASSGDLSNQAQRMEGLVTGLVKIIEGKSSPKKLFRKINQRRNTPLIGFSDD